MPDDVAAIYHRYRAQNITLHNTHARAKITYVNERKVDLRSLLQWWATEFRRAADPRYWVDQLLVRLIDAQSRGKNVVIDDARFENELDDLSERGAFHIYIITNKQQREERLAQRDGKVQTGIAGHASETASENTDDRNAFVIDNIDSPGRFFSRVDDLVAKLPYLDARSIRFTRTNEVST